MKKKGSSIFSFFLLSLDDSVRPITTRSLRVQYAPTARPDIVKACDDSEPLIPNPVVRVDENFEYGHISEPVVSNFELDFDSLSKQRY